MSQDVRDKARLDSEDVLGLNFIQAPGIYVYRRHFHNGLRSHIMEVLNPEDVRKETEGTVVGGLAWFPKARPLKMLRIFRMRFNGLDDALKELRRVKIIETYLSPDHAARSQEFLVTYVIQGDRHLLLCGLQEYVEGEKLDPWSPLDRGHLLSLLERMDGGGSTEGDKTAWLSQVRQKAGKFIENTKEMILREAHIPDLAGIGNLVLTRSGDIKLVDINNISPVSFGPDIYLDDRGYPVCDKSVEALYLLERKLLGSADCRNNGLYGVFLEPRRMEKIKAMEMDFHRHMMPGRNGSGYHR